jgi:tetratricopeptide (TPR) repeat protein
MRVARVLFLIPIYLFSCLTVFSQVEEPDTKNLKSIFRDAEDYFTQGDYDKAYDHYLQLLESKPDNALWNYKAGFCALNTYDHYQESINLLKEATKNTSEKYDFFSFR